MRLLGTDWQPNKWLYGFYGSLVLLTLGLFSFIISPYYLYQRRKYVGAIDESTEFHRNGSRDGCDGSGIRGNGWISRSA